MLAGGDETLHGELDRMVAAGEVETMESLPVESWKECERRKEAQILARGVALGMARGQAPGRAQGIEFDRCLLGTQAARRFGAATTGTCPARPRRQNGICGRSSHSGKVNLFATVSPAEMAMKAFLPVYVVVSLLAYAAHSAAQSGPSPTTVEDHSPAAAENESEILAGKELRECLLEKTWSECGLVPFSYSELLAQIESETTGHSRTVRISWTLLGPWAKTIPEYSTQ